MQFGGNFDLTNVDQRGLFFFFFFELQPVQLPPRSLASPVDRQQLPRAVLHTLHILPTSLDVCSQRLPCGGAVE